MNFLLTIYSILMTAQQLRRTHLIHTRTSIVIVVIPVVVTIATHVLSTSGDGSHVLHALRRLNLRTGNFALTKLPATKVLQS